KMTRTFMRVREIHFFEAHTAHATFSDAEQQIQEDLQMNERIMRLLALPYIVSRRPDWDKFPGSHYSLGADALLPSGRAAQLATFHQYKDNFAKVYDVTYETEDGEHRFVHQTTDGMSERLLGAMISIHGDENGLVLPTAAAPVQAVVVPILEKGRQEEMLLEAQRLFLELRDRAEKLLKDNTFTITDLAKARDGFNRMGWCGKDSCGKAITERTGMSVLGMPFYPEPFEGACIVDGVPTKQVVYAAKAY